MHFYPYISSNRRATASVYETVLTYSPHPTALSLFDRGGERSPARTKARRSWPFLETHLSIGLHPSAHLNPVLVSIGFAVAPYMLSRDRTAFRSATLCSAPSPDCTTQQQTTLVNAQFYFIASSRPSTRTHGHHDGLPHPSSPRRQLRFRANDP